MRDVGQPILAADPLSSGSSLLKAGWPDRQKLSGTGDYGTRNTRETTGPVNCGFTTVVRSVVWMSKFTIR
jgi:hypothetical protein